MNLLRYRSLLAAMALLLLTGCSAPANSQDPLRPRTVITTDGEVDDYDSFIRLLLYANDLDIEAIVYTSSSHHWAGDGKGTLLVPQNRAAGERNTEAGMENPEPRESYRWIGTDWCQELIDKYAECWPNLLEHDSRYPSPEYLHSIMKMGNVAVEGDMAEPTEGSDYIRDLILDDKPGRLYVQLWGGTNTVARALLSIEEQYKNTPDWENIYRKVSDKVVLNLIQNQDGTYTNYVAKAWPGIRTIYNADQFFGFAYLWNMAVPQPLKPVLGGKWFEENIVKGHGPLAAEYCGVGSGYFFPGDPNDRSGDPEMAERMHRTRYDFISEGDSPSFFVLLDCFGLRSVDHPEWGSVGGRYVQDPKAAAVYRDPQPEGGFRFNFGPRRPGQQPEPERPKVLFDRSAGDFNPYTGEVDLFYPQTRWVEVLQNDFAARADWCVRDYAGANHRPAVAVKGRLDVTAAPGGTVRLKGAATDPDGDDVALKWWQYREAGSCDEEIVLGDGAEVSFTVPADAPSGSTLHFILQGSDNGSPVLTHFQRVIVTVK